MDRFTFDGLSQEHLDAMTADERASHLTERRTLFEGLTREQLIDFILAYEDHVESTTVIFPPSEFLAAPDGYRAWLDQFSNHFDVER